MRFKSKFLLLFLCAHLFQSPMIAERSTIRLHLGIISVDLEEIKQNPITSSVIVSSILSLAYFTQEYWLEPIKNVINKITSRKDESRFSDFIKSRARIYRPGDITTRLSDVAGLEAAKMDVTDIMSFLKHPKPFIDMGATIPKGVLMEGPPGNGKTLLSKAIAGEVDCPFISVCGSEFSDMFVGVGASRVREMFDIAKMLARDYGACLIFIDEFDTLGKKRSAMGSGGDQDQAQTLTQLLTLMDGFDEQENPIIILAATNRVEVLDPAVIRPGRFDRIVKISTPYFKDRIDILKVHLKHVKKSHKLNLNSIASATTGFSGADLAHLVNEAAILAVNDKSHCVEMKHFDQAYDNITLGRETKGMGEQLEDDLFSIAIHEAGHSVVRVGLPDATPLYKVTITPRGRALGISFSRPVQEKYQFTETEMKAEITVCLAGGLAEQAFGFGQNNGKSGDLMKARNLAYNMVTLYGMSEDLKYMSYHDIDHMLPNDVATKIHEEVKKIIDECYDNAQDLIEQYYDQIEQLALLLMEEGTVFGDVVYQMCGIPDPRLESIV